MGSFHKMIQLVLEFFKTPSLVLHFWCFILVTFLLIVSVILLSMLMILLYCKCNQASDQCQQLEMAVEIESDLRDTMNGVRKWLFLFQSWFQTQLVLFDWSNNTGAIDVKMDGSVPEEQSSFTMVWFSSFSKLDWGSCIASITKTVSKKIGTLIHFMKFFSPEVPLYIYKSTVWTCMEYCRHS